MTGSLIGFRDFLQHLAGLLLAQAAGEVAERHDAEAHAALFHQLASLLGVDVLGAADHLGSHHVLHLRGIMMRLSFIGTFPPFTRRAGAWPRAWVFPASL